MGYYWYYYAEPEAVVGLGACYGCAAVDDSRVDYEGGSW